jgi:hypothetical protein
MNCHTIEEVGPVPMNKANGHLFKLTAKQRQLLMAGQRVDVPSPLQRLRTPAILRDDVFPHDYVGVCSNCHLILNIRPRKEFFTAAMQQAYLPLQTGVMSRDRLVRGGERERHDREFYRNIWGFVALCLFLVSIVYIGIKTMIRIDRNYAKKFKIKKWFTAHEWASSGFAAAAVFHWYYSDRGNNFLHLALIIVLWLTGAGYVLRYKLAEKDAKQNVRLVHTQQYLFYGLITLLVVGHFFAEFE